MKDGVLSVVIAEALGTEKCCDIHIGMVRCIDTLPKISRPPLENRQKKP